MKVNELKKLLNDIDNDYDIYVRDVNGCVITDKLTLKRLWGKYNSYLLENL